jgi:hypothetical protein
MSRLRPLAALPVALLLMAPSAIRPETILDSFPLVIEAGVTVKSEMPETGERFLPDLPFNSDRGYGHVGGRAESLSGAAAFGGSPSWPLAWREGVEKYVVRVPRGEYLIEMSFLETEVAYRGLRVFDVFAEEKELFPRLDIVEKAGDFTWLTLTGVVSVYDGWLDLRFVSVTAERPPRLSRLRILKGKQPGAEPSPPEAPRLEASGGPGQNLLRWEGVKSEGVIGYGVFRSEAAEGPFEALTSEPVATTQFVDSSVLQGHPYFYRVRAYDAWGAQGPLSEPARAASRQAGDLGLKVYDLRIPEEELRRMAVRQDPRQNPRQNASQNARQEPRRDCGVEVPGELHYLNAVYYVNVGYDTSPACWQRKKSFHLALDEDRSHPFPQRRKSLFFSAEAGDPTLLRERVSAEAAASIGLGTPSVEPVILLVNGRFQGVYFDIEALDRRFRQRARLDRVGLLARKTRGDLLAPDGVDGASPWQPYGEQQGEEGNLMSLNDLVHELNRLEEGEMPRFFNERFYLDRTIDRMALSALRGEVDRTAALNYFLKDSRNGKWELLQDSHRSGDWGIDDFETRSRKLSPAAAARMLFGGSLELGGDDASSSSVLETRFLRGKDLRRRLLDRVESLLSSQLSQESFDSLVDKAFAQVREAGLQDLYRWPQERGAPSFLDGPARLKEGFRARSEALRQAMALERSKAPPPLLLNEVLALPQEGVPWLEVRNASSEPVHLGEYCLTGSFTAPARPFRPSSGTAPLPDLALAPGELFKLKLPETLAASGGFLGLFRAPASAGEKARFADGLFLGPQTKGVSYGRSSEGWAFFSSPTPGAMNGGRELKPPPYEFRQGLVLEKSGDITLWLKTKAEESTDGGRAAKVILKYREEGAQSFQTVDLLWDDKSFRFAMSLKADPARKRTEYYFVAVSADGLERNYPLPAPGLTYVLPVRPNVKINEVLPRPFKAPHQPTGESPHQPTEESPHQPTGGPASPGEFVELYNASDQPVDLEGYFLSDSSRNPTKWRIPAGNIIKPKGFAVFYADGRDRGNHAGFKLSNSGEFIGLFGRMEEGNLLIDSAAFRGMRTGESWGSSPDGSKNYRAWKDPTPGSRNIPKIPEEYLKKRENHGQPKEAEGDRQRP